MWLLSVEDDQGLTTYTRLDGERCSLGRAPDSDVVLDERNISRKHARLERRGERGWVFVDEGSANRSYLNSRPVRGAVPFGPDDLIYVGSYRLTLQPLARASLPAPPPRYVVPARLRVLAGPGAGAEHLIRRNEIVTLGRNDDCTLPFLHEDVAGLHAMLCPLAGGHYEIVDKCGLGVRVNGRRLRRTVLEGGDAIGIAGVVLLRYFEPGQTADPRLEVIDDRALAWLATHAGPGSRAVMMVAAPVAEALMFDEASPGSEALSSDDASQAGEAPSSDDALPAEASGDAVSLETSAGAPDDEPAATGDGDKQVDEAARSNSTESRRRPRSRRAALVSSVPLVLVALAGAFWRASTSDTPAAPLRTVGAQLRAEGEASPPGSSQVTASGLTEVASGASVMGATIAAAPADRAAGRPAWEGGERSKAVDPSSPEARARARARLEARLRSGRASTADARALMSLCKGDGDAGCARWAEELLNRPREQR
jgi:FHA domain